jgi:DNA-binding NarL/FixJ family response regulator
MTGAVERAIENWLHGLTPREYQVALMVGRGLSNKEVARGLGISDGTVKLHVHNIFQKLGAKNRYGLIQRVIWSGSAVGSGLAGSGHSSLSPQLGSDS